MTNIQIPGGFFDSNVELFSKNGQPMAVYEGKIISVYDLPIELFNTINNCLLSNDEAIDVLEQNEFKTHKEKLAKYIECRFGVLDHVPDIENNELQKPEFVCCSLRGKCNMEGFVCSKISFNGKTLTDFELKLINELATEYTIPVIAENLGVCKNTLEFKKKILFQKLNVLSRARLVAVAFEKNLINRNHGG